MRIGDAAKALGVARETIRSWERRGLIPPARRDRNQQRRYTRQDLERIRHVVFPRREQDNEQAAQRLGRLATLVGRLDSLNAPFPGPGGDAPGDAGEAAEPECS